MLKPILVGEGQRDGSKTVCLGTGLAGIGAVTVWLAGMEPGSVCRYRLDGVGSRITGDCGASPKSLSCVCAVALGSPIVALLRPDIGLVRAYYTKRHSPSPL